MTFEQQVAHALELTTELLSEHEISLGKLNGLIKDLEERIIRLETF
jgi:hypothetical protein